MSKKKICVSVWNVSKWFLKFRAGDVSLDDAPQSGRPVEVEGLSNPDINWEQSMLYHAGDSWHTQSIQINKVIGVNEKCLLFYRKN